MSQLPRVISITDRARLSHESVLNYRDGINVINVAFHFLREKDGNCGIVTRLRYRVTITSKSRESFLTELNDEIENSQ